VQHVDVTKSSGAIGETLLVDQKGESDAGVLAKLLRVGPIAEAYSGQVRAPVSERLLLCAQLRDMLAAEDSTIVAQKDQDRRLTLPKRAEAEFPASRIRQDDRR
jgi:hypothetical protein